MNLEPILQILSNWPTAVIATIVAYGLYMLLGKRWLDAQFNKNLEKYKAIQEKEFEEYKAKISALFNRITKIHEKEFEMLPILWYKLQDALSYINTISSWYKEFVRLDRLDRLNDKELVEFLSGVDKLWG
jgi:hypothetical protein